jgi:hypothetical protein
MASPPAVGAIQVRVFSSSSFSDEVETVYATHTPSALICGSSTSRT